jgi:hypothetical protein
MGKPSKNQRVSSDRPVQKDLLGKAVMYIGSYGTEKECPTCKKKVTRAIMWEHGNTMYCTRGCIPVSE